MEDNNQIWVAFKSGEENAFSNLYFTYYLRLYNYGVKLIQEEELVKDVLQDFFLYLFENRANLEGEVKNITSYLLVSFRRRLLRKISTRKISRNHQHESIPKDFLFVINIEDIIIEKESKEQKREQVLCLLNELPSLQREILYLKYYMNLSLADIAEALDISYQVVANHLYRAHKKLKGRVHTSVKGVKKEL
ncbi:MAG: sigma-70 family RNA polymerase sigma factor [Saprospiraceae bacterium]